MDYTLPKDRVRVAGLVHERNEARDQFGSVLAGPAAVREWAAQGDRIRATQPCGECAHFRYAAGQDVLLKTSVKLDMNDIGWDKWVALQQLGRCALREDLLTHRLATCAKWRAI